MQKEPNHIAALDGVRGLAALMVMIFHGWLAGVFDSVPLINRLARIAIFGQTGVDLFFVLSGFLITRILIASKGGKFYFKSFYVRRALRIFPLYYFFLLLFCVLTPLIEGHPITPFRHWWWFLVYLQNVPMTFTGMTMEGPVHFWSLAVEEHFYLLWPLLVFLVPVRKLASAACCLIGLASVTRGIFLFGFKVGVFTFTLCRMDALAFGALLACLEHQGVLSAFKPVFALVLTGVLPAIVLIWAKLSGSGADWLELLKFLFIGLIYWSLLGLTVAFQDTRGVKLLFGNKPLRFAGKISYGLYVYHPLFFYLVFNYISVARHGIIALTVGIAVCFLFSYISFRLLERPFLKLKKYFKYGLSPISDST